MRQRLFTFTLAVRGLDTEDRDLQATLRRRGLGDAVFERRGEFTIISVLVEGKTPRAALRRAVDVIEDEVDGGGKVAKVLDELLTMEEAGKRMHMRGDMIPHLVKTMPGAFPAPEGLSPDGTRLWRWSELRLFFIAVGHKAHEELGEPLPSSLINEANLRFELRDRPADDPGRIHIPRPEEFRKPGDLNLDNPGEIVEAIERFLSDPESDRFKDP